MPRKIGPDTVAEWDLCQAKGGDKTLVALNPKLVEKIKNDPDAAKELKEHGVVLSALKGKTANGADVEVIGTSKGTRAEPDIQAKAMSVNGWVCVLPDSFTVTFETTDGAGIRPDDASNARITQAVTDIKRAANTAKTIGNVEVTMSPSDGTTQSTPPAKQRVKQR